MGLFSSEEESYGANQKEQRRCSSIPLHGALTITGGFLTHFIIGSLYTWGNMSPYVVSYMRIIAKQHYEPKHFSWALSLLFASQSISMLFAGKIMDRIGPRWTMLIGGSIMSLGIFVASYVLHSYAGFMITYSVLFGFGVGFCYGPPLGCALRWFPNNKALVSGLVVSGVGSSAIIFNQIQTAWINPQNLPKLSDAAGVLCFQDTALLHRVPRVIFFSSILYFAVIALSSLLVSLPTVEYELLQSELHKENEEKQQIGTRQFSVELGAHHEDAKTNTSTLAVPVSDATTKPQHKSSTALHHSISSATTEIQTVEDLTPRQTLRTTRFYYLCVMFFFNSMAVTFFASNWKMGPGTNIFGDKFLYVVGSFGSAAICLGRIAWGQLGDRTSLRISFAALCTVFSVAFIFWGLVSYFSGYLAGFLVCVTYACVGGNYALFPPLVTVAFGKTNFTTIIGMLFLVHTVSPPCASLLDMALRGPIGVGPLGILFGSCVGISSGIALYLGKQLDKPCPVPSTQKL